MMISLSDFIDHNGFLEYTNHVSGRKGNKLLFKKVITWSVSVQGDTKEEARQNLIKLLERIINE